MKIQEALDIFGLTTSATQEQIKSTYKKLSRQYHPDLGGSEEMMKILNNAYDSLKHHDGDGSTSSSTSSSNLSATMNDILNKVKKAVDDDVTIEIVGNWIWVSGNTYPIKEVLKEIGFKFSGSKKMWFYAPYKTKRTYRKEIAMDTIRQRYGSELISGEKTKKIA